MKKIILLYLCISIISLQILHGAGRNPSVGPLFTFGQNIMRKHELFISGHLHYYGDEYKGHVFEYDTHVLYAFTQYTYLQVIMPLVLDRVQEGVSEQGISNLEVNLEQTIWNHEEKGLSHRGEIFTGVILPTASIHSYPGERQSAFFVGLTNALRGHYWHAFSAYGALFGLHHTDEKKQKIKSERVYELDCGIGRKIAIYPDDAYLLSHLIFSWFYEIRRFEDPKIKTQRRITLWLGPDIKWSTEDITIQAGFQYPMTARQPATKEKRNFRTQFKLTWKF